MSAPDHNPEFLAFVERRLSTMPLPDHIKREVIKLAKEDDEYGESSRERAAS